MRAIFSEGCHVATRLASRSAGLHANCMWAAPLADTCDTRGACRPPTHKAFTHKVFAGRCEKKSGSKLKKNLQRRRKVYASALYGFCGTNARIKKCTHKLLSLLCEKNLRGKISNPTWIATETDATKIPLVWQIGCNKICHWEMLYTTAGPFPRVGEAAHESGAMEDNATSRRECVLRGFA